MSERNIGGEWTAEKLTTIQSLWLDGKTALEIGAHFGVSKGVICGFLFRMKKLGWDATRPRASSGTRKPGKPPKVIPPVVEKVVRVKRALKPAVLKLVTPAPPVPPVREVVVVAPPPKPEPAPPAAPPIAPAYAPLYYRNAPPANTCQFPSGHPRMSNFSFCGCIDVVPGRPYCAVHSRIAYVSASNREGASHAAS